MRLVASSRGDGAARPSASARTNLLQVLADVVPNDRFSAPLDGAKRIEEAVAALEKAATDDEKPLFPRDLPARSLSSVRVSVVCTRPTCEPPGPFSPALRPPSPTKAQLIAQRASRRQHWPDAQLELHHVWIDEEKACAAMAVNHLKVAERKEGVNVLVHEDGEDRWKRGIIEKELNRDEADFEAKWAKIRENLPEVEQESGKLFKVRMGNISIFAAGSRVLVPSSGGIAALLREAAAAGLPARPPTLSVADFVLDGYPDILLPLRAPEEWPSASALHGGCVAADLRHPPSCPPPSRSSFPPMTWQACYPHHPHRRWWGAQASGARVIPTAPPATAARLPE